MQIAGGFMMLRLTNSFPLLSSAKFWLFGVIPVLLVACAHRSKPVSALASLAKTQDEETVVKKGDSAQAVYSPSGDRLLYISWNRNSHSGPEVYEKDLTTGVERRLTYQNGQVFSPRYHPFEPWIVYASTTDETKEYPPLLNPAAPSSPLPERYNRPTEIYIHSLTGLEITRVTNRRGFDGEPRFSYDGKQLIWTRAYKDRIAVAVMNRATNQTVNLSGLGLNPTNYVSSQDRNLRAWIQWDKKFKNSKLKLRLNQRKTFEVNPEHQVIKTDLALSTNNQFLTWAQMNALSQKYEIWVYDLARSCAYMVIGRDDADRRHPTFSPDGRFLTYTVIRGERSRIENVPFAAPDEPCPTER